MNCRPGDIALVVRGSNQGALVYVEGDCTFPFGVLFEEGKLWNITALTSVKNAMDEVMPPGSRMWCGDWRLRPLRDHGDDARDETLAWRPVPTKQTETA